MQRKDAILLSASDHFGRFGFRGASLRDIARDAGVSLPLLSHYFGGKARLLATVISEHRYMLEERSQVSRRAARAGTGMGTVQGLLQAWVRVAFDTAAKPGGAQYLRLVARIADDPAEESVLVARQYLDTAGHEFTAALTRCYPRASQRAVASAYLCVNTSLLSYLTRTPGDSGFANGPASPGCADDDAHWRACFLAAGIDAALRLPTAGVEADHAVARELSDSYQRAQAA